MSVTLDKTQTALEGVLPSAPNIQIELMNSIQSDAQQIAQARFCPNAEFPKRLIAFAGQGDYCGGFLRKPRNWAL